MLPLCVYLKVHHHVLAEEHLGPRNAGEGPIIAF